MKIKREVANPGESGFTIVELLIATVVFSVVLLICAFGLLQITRTYYKGVTSTNTQQSARAIIDTVSQAIQFSGGDIQGITPNGSTLGFCVNDKRFNYKIGQQVVSGSPDTTQNQGNHGFTQDSAAGCSSATLANNVDAPTGQPRELLSNSMRLVALNICGPGGAPAIGSCPSPPPAGSNLYRVTVRVVAGHNDILNSTRTDCSGVRSGTQFCALSELTTTVQKRV